jgi:hypothetical protein
MIVKNIDKVIQQTLKNRERALGRKTPTAGVPVNDNIQPPLSISDMASRTVFVRMISNRQKPVVLQGGEMKPNQTVTEASTDADGNPVAASTNTDYNDMKSQFGFNNVYKKANDGTIRYLSGIKDISVEYKGGYNAIRTANVNWTAASLDDLDRLTPHFLTPGLTVLLDWGWVTKEPPSTFFKDGVISPEAFKNPQRKIYENKGDYDALAGTISNFNYKLNEDGTFDCSTTITAMGVNLFESVQTDKGANSQIKNSEDKLEINRDGLINAIINLPRIIIHDYFNLKYNEKIEAEDYSGDYDALVNWGAQDLGFNLAGKFLSFSSKYIITEYNAGDKRENPNLNIEVFDSDSDAKKGNKAQDHYIAYIPKKPGSFESDVIFAKSDYDSNVREDFFVRWGWFEDNILSRYTSLYPDNDDKELINEFRSIDTIFPTGSNDEIKKSVKIRNNHFLSFPKDTFKFILPGQHINQSEILELGNQFNTDESAILNFVDRLFKMNSGELKFSTNDEKEEGYLRNVMVNVKEIQMAFGIKNPDSINEDTKIGRFYGPDFVEPVSDVKAGIMNLANSLSQNYFDFWDFKIVPDTFSDGVKLIDGKQTDVETKYTYTAFVENSHEVSQLGLYKFPTFQAGSIVKSQTMESKIIDALTITTMYGANQDKNDKVKLDITNQSPQNQLLYSNDKGEEYEDKYLNKIQKAYIKIIEEDKTAINKIGNENSDPNTRISTDGGFIINPKSQWWASWSETNADKDFFDKVGEYFGNLIETVKTKYNEGLDNLKKFGEEIDAITDEKVFDEKGLTGSVEAIANATIKNVGGEVGQGIKKIAEGRKWETKEQKDEIAAAIAKRQIDDIANFSKAVKTYIFNGDAGNGEQYELTLTDAFVATIRERLYFDGKNADQFKTNYLHPIDLSLEVDGIGGILPGEIIQSDYMPKKYNQEIPGVGPFSFFQIFNLTQKVGIDGWSTEIGTKMRVNSKALDVITWEYSDDTTPAGESDTDTTGGESGNSGEITEQEELDVDDFETTVDVKNNTFVGPPPPTTEEIKKAEESKVVQPTAVIQLSTKTNDKKALNVGTNTTFRGTAAQNEIIYKIVSDWRPEGAGGKPKNTSYYTERPDDKIPIIIRQLFWDNYVEMPNEDGVSKVTSVTSDMEILVINWPKGPDLVHYPFNNQTRSKAGKYNTMSYINSKGEKVEFSKGSLIYFPNKLID